MTNSANHDVSRSESPAQAAALWWVGALMRPKLDNGTKGENPALDTVIKMIEEGPHPDSEELALFGQLLSESLSAELDTIHPDDWYTMKYGVHLGVDYDPCQTLRECAARAGLRLGMGDWPWKTTMNVTKDEVIVSHGYRAEPETIWSST